MEPRLPWKSLTSVFASASRDPEVVQVFESGSLPDDVGIVLRRLVADAPDDGGRRTLAFLGNDVGDVRLEVGVEVRERLVAVVSLEHLRQLFEALHEGVVSVAVVPRVVLCVDAVAEERRDVLLEFVDVLLFPSLEPVHQEVGVQHVYVCVELVEQLLAHAVLIQRHHVAFIDREAVDGVVVLGVISAGEPDGFRRFEAERDAHVGPTAVVGDPRLRDALELHFADGSHRDGVRPVRRRRLLGGRGLTRRGSLRRSRRFRGCGTGVPTAGATSEETPSENCAGALENCTP